MLFPVTFDDETTLASVRTALDGGRRHWPAPRRPPGAGGGASHGDHGQGRGFRVSTFVPWRDLRWIVVGVRQYPAPARARLGVRRWTGGECGTVLNRDVHAARDIRRPLAAARPESRPLARGG